MATPDGPGNGSDFRRGKESGRQDAKLEEHGERLDRINGSIEKTADQLAAVRNRLTDLTAEIEGLRQDARLREDRVSTAASTLADETERRRSELADTAAGGDRRFNRGHALLAAGVGIVGLALAVALKLIG